jgi:hypothetical protein
MRAILDLFPGWYQGFFGVSRREAEVDRDGAGKFYHATSI